MLSTDVMIDSSVLDVCLCMIVASSNFITKVRGGDARTVLDADKYTQQRDDQGNLIEDEDDIGDFEDDDVDESNLVYC